MKPVLLIAFMLAAICADAQGLNEVLFYDNNGKPARPKKAAMIVEKKYINDTLWEWNYYEAKSPRVLSVRYKDQQGKVRNGEYTTYTEEGYIDTSGYYRNGKRDGEWTVNASNHHLLYLLFYRDGELVAKRDSAQFNDDMNQQIDSLFKNTSTFVKVEIESEYPGGAGAWSKYIQKNLVYPEEAYKNNVMGNVIVQFIVDKQGYVTNVGLAKSAEFYLDREALRLISDSPQWTPAIQDGKPVKSYKKQPIYFRF
jgi:periplasmic protein TonB